MPYVDLNTIHNPSTGTSPPATWGDAVRDNFEDLNTRAGAASWSTFAPSWSSTGSAPSIGNGTLTGKYIKVGANVYVRIALTFGSTTTAGTGNYRFSLPVTAAAGGFTVGGSYANDSSTGWYFGGAWLETTTTLMGVTPSASANQFWGAALPFTFANGDVLTLSGVYEGV